MSFLSCLNMHLRIYWLSILMLGVIRVFQPSYLQPTVCLSSLNIGQFLMIESAYALLRLRSFSGERAIRTI